MNRQDISGRTAVQMTDPRPTVQTDEELNLVKRYVILGIAVRILNHDIRVVGASSTKLPRLYESVLRALQDRVLLELAALRRTFRTSDIRIHEERHDQEGLFANYAIRGCQHQFTMLWGYVRAEAERLLKSYYTR